MRKSLLLFVISLISWTIHSQDLYDIGKIQELKIYFEDPNWDTTLDSLKQEGTKKRIKADIKLNGISYSSCGVRFKGNSSYNNARNVFGRKMPINVKADFINENQSFSGGYTSLKLANGFRDPSFVREVLSYEIARKYMPAPKCNFMHVYINDEYYGLYTSVESINHKFMKDHLDNEKGVLVKCDPEYSLKPPASCPKNANKATLEFMGFDSLCYEGTYEMKSDIQDYKSVIALTKRLKDELGKTKEILDVDQALWMLAYNNVLVNLDSYSGRLAHNYYLGKDKTGRWVPLIWDLNLSFGGFRYDGSGTPLDNEGMIKMSPFIHYKNPQRPLIHRLLTISRYRKIYIAHMRTIIKENFSNNWYRNRAIHLQSVVDNAVRKDESKFYSYSSFKENLTKSSKAGKSLIIGIEELMKPRVEFLNNHPIFQKEPPKVSSVQHKKTSGGKVTITCKVENAEKVYVAFRYDKQGYFTKKPLKDDGENNDFSADDGFYGLDIDFKAGMQYYILAENEKTVMLHPERAEFEFHEIKY